METINGKIVKNLQDYILTGQTFQNGANSFEMAKNDDQIVAGGGNVYIDDSDVYHTTLTKEQLLADPSIIESIANYHEENIVPKYRIKRDYYKGRHHTIMNKPSTPLGKPDNRLIVNLPKKLTDTFNGFFIGDPIQIRYVDNTNQDESDKTNEEISNWMNDVNFTDKASEYAKTADIYGRAYFRAFDTADSIDIAVLSPRDTLIVYDNTPLNNPVIAINYSTNGISNDVWVMDDKADYHFSDVNGKFSMVNIQETEEGQPNILNQENIHSFEGFPVFELPENDERVGIFDNVLSLIDAADEILSSKANDINSISNGILVVTGAKLTDDQITNVKTMHVLNLFKDESDALSDDKQETPNAYYVTPDINDDMQEHMLDRTIEQVYQNAQVVNMNDSKFGQSASAISGIALKQRYQDMMSKAETKASKMDSSLRALFSCLFSKLKVDANVQNIEFNHKQSIPKNVLEEAQTVQALDGQVTNETKLSALSLVKDTHAEVQNWMNEQEQGVQNVKDIVNNAITNAGSDNNGGDSDDNSNNSEETD
ncbi:phage portal protein [Apilactobacillus sp. EABW-1NA]|uniref:phage portal protein n=1 Tax=Apilactobacillus sp. EABW-1NA TaxID=2984137 RepID=UPI0025AF6525|nr:phage portal protein [Apilactobacillus sp. EABW-1NA]MDN2613305.1 phage portal protein [Apilactobacillus sp. EABW-1NA]